jgi:hypothetical protein
MCLAGANFPFNHPNVLCGRRRDDDSDSLNKILQLLSQAPTPRSDERQESTAIVRGLSWDDDYFDSEDGIVAVFAFDYDKISSYFSNLAWFGFLYTLFISPVFVFSKSDPS